MKKRSVGRIMAILSVLLLTTLVFANAVVAGSYSQSGKLCMITDHHDGTVTIRMRYTQGDGTTRIWTRMMHVTDDQITELKTCIGKYICLSYHNDIGHNMELVLDSIQILNGNPHDPVYDDSILIDEAIWQGSILIDDSVWQGSILIDDSVWQGSILIDDSVWQGSILIDEAIWQGSILIDEAIWQGCQDQDDGNVK